ncbi:MAG: NAD(P)H-dependent oxidoreductase [Acidobacteriota bacterium]
MSYRRKRKEITVPIKVVAICGSVQPNSNSSKALELVMKELRLHTQIESEAVYLDKLELPLPGMPAKNPPALEGFRKQVKEATGVLLVSPEYHGGVASPMKLAIENLGFPSALASKPISLVGVASGAIGAVKSLEQLRAICSHVGAIPLPLAVSIARVHEVFDTEGNCRDAGTEKMLRGAATNLLDYIKGAICPRITLEAIVRGQSQGG